MYQNFIPKNYEISYSILVSMDPTVVYQRAIFFYEYIHRKFILLWLLVDHFIVGCKTKTPPRRHLLLLHQFSQMKVKFLVVLFYKTRTEMLISSNLNQDYTFRSIIYFFKGLTNSRKSGVLSIDHSQVTVYSPHLFWNFYHSVM